MIISFGRAGILIEKELKYQFNKKDFDILKAYIDENAKLGGVVVQKNYYFDTEFFDLKKCGMTVRVRVKGLSSCEFTVKSEITLDSNNCKIKHEENMALNIKEVREIVEKGNLHEFADLFKEFKSEYSSKFLTKDVKLLGCLETKRTTYNFDGEDGIICFDENSYLDIQDYEIEWETDHLDRAISQMNAIFNMLGIEPLALSDSKSSRFIKCYWTVKSLATEYSASL